MEAGDTKAILLSFGNSTIDRFSVVLHHSFNGYPVFCVNNRYLSL